MRVSFSAREQLGALASLGPRLVRSAWSGAIALIIGLAATTRIYRSETVIMFEGGVQALGHEGESPRVIGARLNDMVMSRSRLEKLIKEMHLYPKVLEKKGLVESIDEMRKHISIGSREGFTFRMSFDGDFVTCTASPPSISGRRASGRIRLPPNRRSSKTARS